jgi:transcription antitermination factor NusG
MLTGKANQNTMKNTEDSLKVWYVVKCNSLAEKKVADRLMAKNFIVYLPLQTVIRQWSDRKKKLKVPLIPSVVFILCSISELNNVYSVQGVCGVLEFLSRPAVVKEAELENLRLLEKELDGQLTCIDKVDFEKGDFVQVVKGPLKGLSGTSVERDGKYRIFVSFESVGMNYMVNVPKSFVKKVDYKKVG